MNLDFLNVKNLSPEDYKKYVETAKDYRDFLYHDNLVYAFDVIQIWTALIVLGALVNIFS